MAENRQPAAAGDRLAKVIARAGLCSRRQAEAWIVAGRVLVNAKPVRTPAFNVTDDDHITVDGEPLRDRQGTRLWLYHKPVGKVVTERDPEGRPTIFADLATKGLPRVMTVGRLDINTEGLLLLTNDGGLKRVLELPSTGWLRRYRVRAHGRVEQKQLDALKKGLEVDGVKYGRIDAEIERVQGSNVWINVALREGKNREIKNVLGALGLEVNRLIRISFGPFQLGELPVDGVDTVKHKMLRDQLGTKLAAEAGVDFESPLPDAISTPVAPARKKVADARGAKNAETLRPQRDVKHGAQGNFRELGKRPRKEMEAPETRRVLFSDGRPPEDFEPKAKKKDDDKGGKSGFKKDDRKPGGKFSGKPGGKSDGKPRRDGPPSRDSRPPRTGRSSDRPSRPRGSSGDRGRP